MNRFYIAVVIAGTWLMSAPAVGQDFSGCTPSSVHITHIVGAGGEALATSRDSRNPMARAKAQYRVAHDPVLNGAIREHNVAIASVVEVAFSASCAATIFVLY